MIRKDISKFGAVSRIAGTAPKAFGALAAVGAIALVSAVPATADDASENSDQPQEEMTKGEARLAKLLEGRVAGEPQECITEFRNTRMTTIDDTAYVYGRGRTIYVQRTRRPESIDRDDILVTRKFGNSRLCRLDMINTIDRYAGFFTGGVQFTQFIPYTKVDDNQL